MMILVYTMENQNGDHTEMVKRRRPKNERHNKKQQIGN